MTDSSAKKKFLALNLFDVTDAEKYLSYFGRVAEAGAPYGAKWVAFGRVREDVAGSVTPRQVLLLVEWASEESFNAFRADPALADLHPLREDGTASYVWHTFEGLDLFAPDLSAEDIAAVVRP